MRQFRRICATIVLALAFTTFSFADDGIIHTGYVPTPTPTPTPLISEGGIIHTGGADAVEEPRCEDETFDVATEVALSLVRSVLALF
jgi:hypothetical protein